MNIMKKCLVGALVVMTSGCFNTRIIEFHTQTETLYSVVLSEQAIHALGDHYDYQIHARDTKNGQTLIQLLHSGYYPAIKHITLDKIKKERTKNTVETCVEIVFDPTKLDATQKATFPKAYQVKVSPQRIDYRTCLENIALVKVENREKLLAEHRFPSPLQTQLIDYVRNTDFDKQATEFAFALVIVAPIYLVGALLALPFTQTN